MFPYLRSQAKHYAKVTERVLLTVEYTPGKAERQLYELLYAYIDVEPVTFNRGFYTVDVRYFYRITADAFVGAARPVEISGLAVFDKRVILFGSEGSAKVFSSLGQEKALDVQNLPPAACPPRWWSRWTPSSSA